QPKSTLFPYTTLFRSIIRNVTKEDIFKIVELQKASFPDMAAYGIIWPSYFLQSHICIFPEGQFCAEVNGRIVGSASSLIVSLKPDRKSTRLNSSHRTI